MSEMTVPGSKGHGDMSSTLDIVVRCRGWSYSFQKQMLLLRSPGLDDSYSQNGLTQIWMFMLHSACPTKMFLHIWGSSLPKNTKSLSINKWTLLTHSITALEKNRLKIKSYTRMEKSKNSITERVIKINKFMGVVNSRPVIKNTSNKNTIRIHISL